MELKKLGKTDLEVSRLGFGGAEIGQQEATQETVTELLNSAIDAGLNLVDTAAAYWKSEEMIGNAIRGRRKEIVLISKCGAVDGFTRSDWTKKGILETIERSLQRLQTDYLDIEQLHSCSSEILERGEVIEALIVAKERGHIRYAGYSGDGEDAVTAIRTDFFDTLQTSVSIADQEAIDLTIPLAKDGEIGVIAKRPIANAVWRHDSKPADAYHHEYWDRVQDLQYDFLEGDLTESVARALSFTLSVDGVATAIVGTTKPSRWQENAEMLEQVDFSSDDFRRIRERWQEISKGKSWKGQI
ncbi:MAG: aldo/keto reductase [Pyrinomonadaceae bacterium]|nr:aldo/keto reductase [Pyrinomonadaceae bacterium]